MLRHVLVDGNNIVGISTFAVERDKKNKQGPHLKSRKGIPTGGLFIFLKTMQKIIIATNPDKVTVCWDGGSSVYRKSIYPKYKVRERDEVYQIFLAQIDLAQKMTPCLGFGNLKIQNYEGDDAIYFMHREILKNQEGTGVAIVSSDKDMLQLIGERTFVYNSSLELIINESNFEEVTKLPLAHYIWCRAMIGDKSDTIPGIPGIGEVTARKIVERKDSLLDFAARRGLDIKECRRTIIRNKKLMDLSLVPFEQDEDLDISIWGGPYPSYEEFKTWCLEFDFLSLIESARHFFSPFLNVGKDIPF